MEVVENRVTESVTEASFGNHAQIEYVPYGRLCRSPLNVRKKAPTGIEALAETIVVKCILQNNCNLSNCYTTITESAGSPISCRAGLLDKSALSEWRRAGQARYPCLMRLEWLHTFGGKGEALQPGRRIAPRVRCVTPSCIARRFAALNASCSR